MDSRRFPELGYDPKKVVKDTPKFSRRQPMIPQRYVPQWQLDMKNRKQIIMNSVMAKNPVWKGHTSYFLCGRERMDATNHRLYRNVLEYSRLLHANSSPFSKYNSGMINMTY